MFFQLTVRKIEVVKLKWGTAILNQTVFMTVDKPACKDIYVSQVWLAVSMPFANSTGILSFKSGYKLMQAVSHLFRWKAPQDYAWKCSLLHYRFLWSNSAMVWFWRRSDWTDTFQNTFAFENEGLSAKRTVLARYTCRANLEQAEQLNMIAMNCPKA